MKALIAKCICFAFMFILISCEDNSIYNPAPPDILIEDLLSSPDTVEVEGRKLYLTTDLWRDFMPIVPPGGRPLNAILFITAIDTMQLPSSITSDAVWIVHNDQVWKSWLSNHNIPPNSPNCIKMIAGNGPKWGPCDSCASAIVRVKDSGGSEYFLLARDQSIGSTW